MNAPTRWKTAWITGASSGIGRALALQLAAAGTQVAVSARSADKLQELGPGTFAYPLDVTDPIATQDTLLRIEKDLGPVELVIFAAGTYAEVAADKINAATFEYIMATNYQGTVNGLAAVLPGMLARERGHVAWIASLTGYIGLPKAAAYGPSKAALISLAESLKSEMARKGIAISVVNPGFVATPMTANNEFAMPFLMQPEEAARRTLDGLARGRFEITYPRRLTLILKLARLLPYSAYFWLIDRFILR